MLERRAVVAVVRKDGRVLMGKKKKDGISLLSGQWHIPGETLEANETDEQGLIRGIMEETGIQVRPGKFLGSHKTPKGTRVNWYECEPESVDIRAGSDIEEVRWVPFEEVQSVCHESAVSLWPIEIRQYFQE